MSNDIDFSKIRLSVDIDESTPLKLKALDGLLIEDFLKPIMATHARRLDNKQGEIERLREAIEETQAFLREATAVLYGVKRTEDERNEALLFLSKGDIGDLRI